MTFSVCCFFFKNILSGISIRVSNSLDPDQTKGFVEPHLGPNCLSEQTTLAGKELRTLYSLFVHKQIKHIWASVQENLSLGFPLKLDSNHSPQLQRLARILKFCLK